MAKNCPNCFGEKVVFNGKKNDFEDCKYCKGSGSINDDDDDDYDDILDYNDFDNFSEEFNENLFKQYTDEEDN